MPSKPSGQRAEIENAGWRVVDSGTGFRLEPANAPDIEVGGEIRYGRSEAVPSRLDEPATGLATVLKSSYLFADKTTVQVIVQDGNGNRWSPRRIGTNADLAYAMKDALATNTLNEGVLKSSVNAGSAVVARLTMLVSVVFVAGAVSTAVITSS